MGGKPLTTSSHIELVMASESREDPGVQADVPPELDEWLDDRAATMGVERDALVAQILASYHAAATLDGELDAAGLLDLDADDFVDVESAVSAAVDEQVEAAVEERLDGALADRVDDLVAERVDAAFDERSDDLADSVAERVQLDVAADRQSAVDELDEEFQAKIDDVRERVVQVKRETDAKAPADHDHEEFDALDALDERVNDLAGDVATLRDDVDERLDEGAEERATLTDRVDDVSEKLNRVAWVVSDLKDASSGRSDHEQAVDRIKRAAAQEGVATATCGRCDETVHLGLLTDPECPHCNAAVSDVRPAGGLFRTKARLVPAAQLESGEEDDA